MIDLLIGPVTSLLDKVIPDADTKAKLAHEIATMSEKHHQRVMLEQIEVLKLDAKGNWFQSSWRPLAGYVCVLGLMVNFLISPMAAGFGVEIPQADAGVMMPLLLGMLGLGGARSFERVKGVGK
ncbi:MAG TPA: hypothetical protein DCW74_06625 [Alteromonas australica]|uniref:Holin of 3TMs, for gene-transfer release n=1 Tax=Alteromonas australica TaxID=589873 RepID=A0A350P278_9ALTE|nr:hypothetical protein [Alteromonas australica]